MQVFLENQPVKKLFFSDTLKLKSQTPININVQASNFAGFLDTLVQTWRTAIPNYAKFLHSLIILFYFFPQSDNEKLSYKSIQIAKKPEVVA